MHYQTRLELVKGLLTFKENCITFEPKKGQKYKDEKSTDDNFFMIIDYQDVCEHQKMKGEGPRKKERRREERRTTISPFLSVLPFETLEKDMSR